MRSTQAHIAIATLAAALATGGCQDPYDRETAGAEHPRITPGAPAGPLPAIVPLPRSSARATARAFAARWVNWDWRGAAAQQRALARLATGRLAGELRASAVATRSDASLRRDTPGVRGQVAAVVLRPERRGRESGLVVTREQTYTAGRADLGGRRYRVYLITLTATPSGWQVSTWQPQP